MQDALSALARRLRFWWSRSAPREHAARILPLVALIAGLGLGIAASVPTVQFVDTVRYEGPIGANAMVEYDFNRTGYSYGEFAFEVVPPCPLRLYVLDATAAGQYRSSSALPDPSLSLNCDRTRGTFSFDIVLLVFVNSASGDASFAARGDLFVLTQPSAIWVVPAYLLFIAGAFGIAVRMLTGGIAKIAEDVARREEIDPREFRKASDPKSRGPR